MNGIPQKFNNKHLIHAWTYRAADGAPMGLVGRYQNSDDGKDVVPFFRRNGSGFRAGAAPEPRPLFGLECLAADTDRRAVIAVEGEKCAAALQSLGLCAVTSPGGSGAATKSDWSPLSGFGKAYLLPDNDEPGEHYARDVAVALAALTVPPALFVARLPGLPAAGDVVDWLQARCPGWNGFDPVPETERGRLREDLKVVLRELAEPPPAEWTAAPAAEPWPEPIPLEAAALPSWPNDVFEESIQDFVSGLAEATETPPELPALFTLTALSAAIQGKFQVRVKLGYFEPVQVWMCPALPPGSRKSAVKDAVIAPLVKWEREQRTALEATIKQAESDQKTITERINQLRKASTSIKTSAADFARLKGEITELEATFPEIPRPPRLFTDDVTPEHLGAMLAEHGERMAILSDEAGIFEQMGGRYSNGVPNLDLFLQGHSGSPVRVDRGSRPPVILHRPALTIGISPQPEVLRGLTEKPGFRGRGLLARFLFALPPSNLGKRTGETRPLSDDLRLRWEGRLTVMLNTEPTADRNGEPCPHTLKLSSETLAAWQAFWHVVEKDMGPGRRFEYLTDWAGKLPGAVARIAGLLHVARYAFQTPETRDIGIEDMSAALRMAEALAAHALAVFDLMGADPELDGARVVLDWIQREGLERFSFRDVHYTHKSRFKRAADLEPVIDVLTERHYIRPIATRAGPKGGRPSKNFEVNPVVHANKGGRS